MPYNYNDILNPSWYERLRRETAGKYASDAVSRGASPEDPYFQGKARQDLGDLEAAKRDAQRAEQYGWAGSLARGNDEKARYNEEASAGLRNFFSKPSQNIATGSMGVGGNESHDSGIAIPSPYSASPAQAAPYYKPTTPVDMRAIAGYSGARNIPQIYKPLPAFNPKALPAITRSAQTYYPGDFASNSVDKAKHESERKLQRIMESLYSQNRSYYGDLGKNPQDYYPQALKLLGGR